MSITDEHARHPGLVRRLLAMLYDALLLLALLFVTTALFSVMFNHGEAIRPGQSIHLPYVALLVLVSFLFYGWFWTHGGQTLGMKTWKMQLLRENGANISWPGALVRFLAAIISWAALGLGYMWVLFDSRNRTWHDIASGSELIDLR